MDPAVRRAILSGATVAEVAERFGLSEPTVYRYRVHLCLRYSQGGRRQGLDTTEGIATPYATTRRPLAQDGLPANDWLVLLSADIIREQQLRKRLLKGARAGIAEDRQQLEAKYRCRLLTPEQHWRTIGKVGYTPRGGSNGR